MATLTLALVADHGLDGFPLVTPPLPVHLDADLALGGIPLVTPPPPPLPLVALSRTLAKDAANDDDGAADPLDDDIIAGQTEKKTHYDFL